LGEEVLVVLPGVEEVGAMVLVGVEEVAELGGELERASFASGGVARDVEVVAEGCENGFLE